jgi:pentose-5-phosphate-3-epimerase
MTSAIFVACQNFNMIKITPAILPHSYRGIEAAAEKVVDAVDSVQIDFVDGHFASNRTWLFNNKDEEKLHDIMDEEMGMPYWDSLNYEFDLMVKDPLQYLETFIALGPSKMIFHIEGLKEEKTLAFFETLPDILQQAIRFGMAIGIDTDPALLAPYMPYIESIQCMGIKNVGFQAQAFDEGVFAQIKRVRELYPDKMIAVDGAVSLENAQQLVEAGVTELVIGSALFQNIDSRATIEAFRKLCATTSPHEN